MPARRGRARLGADRLVRADDRVDGRRGRRHGTRPGSARRRPAAPAPRVNVLVTGSSGASPAVGSWRACSGWPQRPPGQAGDGPDRHHRRRRRSSISSRPPRPDLVIHLAAVSFGPQAELDARAALQVNVGGTAILLQAIAGMEVPAAVVVVGSADVYGSPAADDAFLTEDAPLRPTRVYGLTKLAQEATAIGSPRPRACGWRSSGPSTTRAPDSDSTSRCPPSPRGSSRLRPVVGHRRAGNIDVVRDIGDVRDTVRAYRLLGEALVGGGVPSWGPFNVATGSGVAIRTIIDRLSVAAGHPSGRGLARPRAAEDPGPDRRRCVSPCAPYRMGPRHPTRHDLA